MKKSRILAGIWMLFLVLAYLVSASITIGIAAVATVLLCFFCFFLSIAMKNKVTCYFEVPDMAEKEQQVYGKLIFENHSLLPAGRLRAELLFQNLLTGEKEICHLDSMAAGKEKTETKWSVCSNCCGAIRISVQKLLVSDMLGLFLSEQKLNISDTMIVLPEMKTVEVQVGDSFTTDWESIQYSEQKKGDDPGETFGIREYQPGDSTKMIHWKISQKLGELYVKEPGLPVENAVLLFFETAKLTGDSRTSDQAELMEKLISVSENLTEKGMHGEKCAFLHPYHCPVTNFFMTGVLYFSRVSILIFTSVSISLPRSYTAYFHWREKKKHSQACRNMHRNIRSSHLDIFSILPQKIREIWQISLHGSAVSRPYGQEKMSVSC